MERKRDLWLWNSKLLRPVVHFSIGATLVVVITGYAIVGTESLYFLLFGLVGPLIGLIYGFVGKKVQQLKASIPPNSGVMAESLIVLNKIQSPGIVVLSNEKLRLIPIIGKELQMDLKDITFLRKVKYFNGKTLLWKKWLVLSTNPRLGFALPEEEANAWHGCLSPVKSSLVEKR